MKGFIELTLDNKEQSKIYINTRNVTCITNYNYTVVVYTNESSESSFNVEESYEKIKELIKKS